MPTHTYWAYELAHESVHGSDAAWIFARRTVAGVVGLHAKTNDPGIRAGFAEFAASSVAAAAVAASLMFDWLEVSSLNEPLRLIRERLTR
jgi:hypothetical protein